MYQALRLSIRVFFTSGKAPKEPWMAKQESVRKGSRSPINPMAAAKVSESSRDVWDCNAD